MEEKFAQIVSRIDGLRNGMSVSAFARFLGLPQKSLDNYLKQGRKPSVELVMLVCTRCHVTSDWLLGLSEDGGPQAPDAALSALRNEVADLARRIDAALSARGP